jgi:spermidine dehydrogenase
MSWTDKELGMDRPITRRDFMNGAAMALAAAITPKSLFGQEAQDRPGYDPPAAHGMRGSHAGAFEVAHSLRDGTFWKNAGHPESTGETYDLIVVGGGISGLSSARFFHQAAGKSARVLILENHDDFGGHAKRNEFQVDNTFMLGYGGTYSIESPAIYSPVAKGVVRDLGIDVSSYARHNDEKLYRSLGLKHKIFFDRETFGADRLVEFPAQGPLSEKAKADVKRLYSLNVDLMPGLSSEQKKAKLARMSYADYLTKLVKVEPQVIALLNSQQMPLYGTGIDAIPAQDAWAWACQASTA